MMKRKTVNQSKTGEMDDSSSNINWDFKQIMKDVQLFGISHMTWKERKDLENRKVVHLGGKPPKKQRLPLSVAHVQMKKQKEREEKTLQENMILGRFGGNLGGSSKRSTDRCRPEDRVLRSSEGSFRNGVLDVKHMLKPGPFRDNESSDRMMGSMMGGMMGSKGKKQKGGRKKSRGGGKKKGGGRKRH